MTPETLIVSVFALLEVIVLGNVLPLGVVILAVAPSRLTPVTVIVPVDENITLLTVVLHDVVNGILTGRQYSPFLPITIS